MIEIKFQKELIQLIPSVRLGCIWCEVDVSPSHENILEFSKAVIDDIRSELTMEIISQKPTIKATKEAYRKLGKDPSRYRPSAEALTRRIVGGKALYRINNVIDILNLVSIKSGFSIGGYDANKIEGDIEFGIGNANEPYDAIGRGTLNIENLPIFRDSMGAFGSPTSDSVRTMVTDNTKRFLMIVIDFYRHNNLEQTLEQSAELYKKNAYASAMEIKIISSDK